MPGFAHAVDFEVGVPDPLNLGTQRCIPLLSRRRLERVGTDGQVRIIRRCSDRQNPADRFADTPKDFDTLESLTNICGSFTEINLANSATDRLQELLNGNPWSIETGIDGTGERRLATIRIHLVDVGDILIAERLARRWPDGEEFWCK